ncbi:MAG TPA: hypothetical protein VEK07_06255 [Polyangiaceae bacterium]|nr:hypothetical protein [Polyangiaceae bacterium]
MRSDFAGFALLGEGQRSAGNAAFFALQLAAASFPGDSARRELVALTSRITEPPPSDPSESIWRWFGTLAACLPVVDYGVWDFALVPSVATTEFHSWVDGVRQDAALPADPSETSAFSTEETVYFIATFAAVSGDAPWVDWIRFYAEAVDRERYFERRTFEALVDALAQQSVGLAHGRTDVLFSVMPGVGAPDAADERFITASALRSEGWSYIRPIF